MFKFFGSSWYDFELTRLLGSTSSGGCEVAEFLEAVGKIKKHDPESWHRAWDEQSRRAEIIARRAARHGHAVAARRAFLRAANYARASGYMLTGLEVEARVLKTAERSVSLFKNAIPYMDGQVIVLNIPYEEGKTGERVTLPGYLFLPPASRRLRGGKTPVVINCGGADSTQEELYFAFASAGVDLGYAVLTFDGPGQGLVLKRNKVPMRPDFEAVTSLVLDHLEQHLAAPKLGLDLDMSRIAVMGASMGGYYSLRASVDPRIRACVSIDGFYSLWALALERMPKWYSSMWISGWLPESVFNASVRLGMATDFPTRWEFGLGMSMMGTATPGDTLRRFRAFSLDVAEGGRIVDRVRCPVLLTGASRPLYAMAQDSTLAVYNALTKVEEASKEVWVPEEVGQGALSGKVGAWGMLAEKTFQFLDKHLGVQRDGDMVASEGVSIL